MTLEMPIEIRHIPPYLKDKFEALLPAATSGTNEERELNFLTRALAACAINKFTNCTLQEAAESVVDGGGDGGIDAIFYSSSTRILWVVQSKYHKNGRGEPDLGSVSKFKEGIENLLTDNLEAFAGNSAWTRKIPLIRTILGYGDLQVRALLVYSGINLVSEDRRRLFENLRIRFSSGSDYLQWNTYNLTSIHDWITGADQSPGVAEVELKLVKPGWVLEPYETIYGLIPLTDLAQLHGSYGRKLIAANIRAYKGDTEVNGQIAQTVNNEPEHFFYLNNGLTAYCKRFEVHNSDRADSEKKRIKAYGFSIVNGAQTLGSVAESIASLASSTSNGFVFIKVISLERCVDDRTFADRITRSTNYQNQIRPRDFVALSEQQERIANQLLPEEIFYHYKDGEDTPPPDENNFTLEEATTACATLANTGDCDFCSRIWSNRQSLWSLEEEFPNDLLRSRYSRVFKPDLSARTVWRAVQAQRTVIKALKTSEPGVRKQFFENCRWLILDIIFTKNHPERGDEITLTAQEISVITQKAQEYAELLWDVCRSNGFVTAGASGGWDSTRHFRSIFSSAGDCQTLRNATLARLATSANT